MKTKNPGESAELESSPAALEPKLSASELVRRQLERDISSGVLLPGDALDEDALAKRFGVSRTPVREALLQLSVRGLVLIAPRAGTYVSRLSIPELLGLSELLAELEGACAKLATRRLTPEEAHELRRVHEESLAFESDPEGLQNFLTDADNGVVVKLTATIDRLAGEENSLLASRSDSLQDSIKTNADRLDKLTLQLERQQERLFLQFYQLESIIAKLQSGLSAIQNLQVIPPLS